MRVCINDFKNLTEELVKPKCRPLKKFIPSGSKNGNGHSPEMSYKSLSANLDKTLQKLRDTVASKVKIYTKQEIEEFQKTYIFP